MYPRTMESNVQEYLNVYKHLAKFTVLHVLAEKVDFHTAPLSAVRHIAARKRFTLGEADIEETLFRTR
jgi:hypothetical protein